MVWKGCERSVITYSSLISACEKAGQWELALELFNEMHSEGCSPNTVTFNSLITACAQGERVAAAWPAQAAQRVQACRCQALRCQIAPGSTCCANRSVRVVCALMSHSRAGDQHKACATSLWKQVDGQKPHFVQDLMLSSCMSDTR